MTVKRIYIKHLTERLCKYGEIIPRILRLLVIKDREPVSSRFESTSAQIYSLDKDLKRCNICIVLKFTIVI